MQDGNWTPISKAAVAWLPQDRPYSKVEALYSIQVKINNDDLISISSLATLWQWNRGTVKLFLQSLSVEVVYPAIKFNPCKLGKLRQVDIQVPDRFLTGSRQVRALFCNDLQGDADRFLTGSRQVPDRFPDSSIKTLKTEDLKEESKALAGDDETSPPPPPVKVKKPKPPKEKKPISADHPLFIAWWCHVFEQTQGDTYIVEGAKDGATVKIILEGCKEGIHEAMGRACFFLVEDDPFWRGKHTIALFWSQINKCRPSLSQMDKYRRMGLCPPTGEDVAGWVNAVVAGAMHQAEGVLC